jgi:hypothetical protein
MVPDSYTVVMQGFTPVAQATVRAVPLSGVQVHTGLDTVVPSFGTAVNVTERAVSPDFWTASRSSRSCTFLTVTTWFPLRTYMYAK